MRMKINEDKREYVYKVIYNEIYKWKKVFLFAYDYKIFLLLLIIFNDPVMWSNKIEN